MHVSVFNFCIDIILTVDCFNTALYWVTANAIQLFTLLLHIKGVQLMKHKANFMANPMCCREGSGNRDNSSRLRHQNNGHFWPLRLDSRSVLNIAPCCLENYSRLVILGPNRNYYWPTSQTWACISDRVDAEGVLVVVLNHTVTAYNHRCHQIMQDGNLKVYNLKWQHVINDYLLNTCMFPI